MFSTFCRVCTNGQVVWLVRYCHFVLVVYEDVFESFEFKKKKLMSWQWHKVCHPVSKLETKVSLVLYMYVTGTKCEEHCLKISRDILDLVFYCFSEFHCSPYLHNTKTSISLKQKKIIQKGKCHSSFFSKAFRRRRNYILVHRHFKLATRFYWSNVNQFIVSSACRRNPDHHFSFWTLFFAFASIKPKQQQAQLPTSRNWTFNFITRFGEYCYQVSVNLNLKKQTRKHSCTCQKKVLCTSKSHS